MQSEKRKIYIKNFGKSLSITVALNVYNECVVYNTWKTKTHLEAFNRFAILRQILFFSIIVCISRTNYYNGWQ